MVKYITNDSDYIHLDPIEQKDFNMNIKKYNVDALQKYRESGIAGYKILTNTTDKKYIPKEEQEKIKWDQRYRKFILLSQSIGILLIFVLIIVSIILYMWYGRNPDNEKMVQKTKLIVKILKYVIVTLLLLALAYWFTNKIIVSSFETGLMLQKNEDIDPYKIEVF